MKSQACATAMVLLFSSVIVLITAGLVMVKTSRVVGIALFPLSIFFILITICIIVSYLKDSRRNSVSVTTSSSINAISTVTSMADVEMRKVSIDADSRMDVNLAKSDQQTKSPDATIVVFKYP